MVTVRKIFCNVISIILGAWDYLFDSLRALVSAPGNVIKARIAFVGRFPSLMIDNSFNRDLWLRLRKVVPVLCRLVVREHYIIIV